LPGVLDFFLILTIITIIVSGTFLYIRCIFSEDIHFVNNSTQASWITYPQQISTISRPVNPQATIFRKTFFVDEQHTSSVYLNIKALHNFRLFINGLPVNTDYLITGSWKKKARINITKFTHAQANSIEVAVMNRMGPPLLWLYSEGLENPVKTDYTWIVQTGENPESNAVLANDTLPYREITNDYSPYKYLLDKKITLLSALVLMGLLFFWGCRTPTEGLINRSSRFILFGIALTLFSIFCFKSLRMYPTVGFDAQYHIQYILYILTHKRLPTALEGSSMFHPPFFYIISALLCSALEYIHQAFMQQFIVKVIPFACSMGNVFMTYLIGKKVFRNRPKHILFVALFAGIIPMNIYLSAYIGNEPLHSFLVSCSIFFAVDILTDNSTRYSKVIYLGIFMGLASITKVTAITIFPVIFLFIFVKMLFIDMARLHESINKIVALLIVIVVISGWYYVRNFVLFGKLIMINWNLPTGMWWQDPGFHTLKYYLGFGEVFKHPLYSGFHSFWDSIYSTFWGDGYIGGIAFINQKGATLWNYEYMSIVYLLAIPATIIFLIGLYKMIRDMFNNTVDKHYRITISFLALCLYAV